ncbi:MAG: TMEM14 family protein [Verrucomicrobiota bacterium]|nr:TMEM14 family protein [Verrucomicrobiota bacterium]
MFNQPTCWAVLLYGILVTFLGYMGYRQQHSIPSLIAGGGLGSLLILSSIFLFAKHKLGAYGSLLLTIALTATFCVRYFKTGKPLTAALAILSGAMLLFLLSQFSKWRRA